MNYDIKNIIATFAQKGVDNTQYNPFAGILITKIKIDKTYILWQILKLKMA